ncbi:MAG TPA: GMC family oxidoreductase, partial [Candidatus Binatia bacterium]|nr:GMC family oxidoreductase [Candidatus Binatia bacterium]
ALSTIRLLKSELERTGFGQFHVALENDDYSWPTDMRGDEHHSGTTRMHPDPKQGVVDENCRVHSVHNLYVAGSSVFPNIGASNPTLTIIALALRLADHLKQKLA